MWWNDMPRLLNERFYKKEKQQQQKSHKLYGKVKSKQKQSKQNRALKFKHSFQIWTEHA